jgi:hypothetical protein
MFISSDPVRLFERHEKVMQAGRAQIYHAPKPHSREPLEYMKPLTRSVIGYAYAMGAWVAAPYDLFVGPADVAEPGLVVESGAARYFGQPKDYADLYGFIRANAEYLDGYERAAFTGPHLPDRQAGNVLMITGGSGGVYAFARTKPQKPNSPLVIHLVDWGKELAYQEGRFRDHTPFNRMSWKRGEKAPFTLKVRIFNCYGNRPFTARLLTPPPYDEKSHWHAEKTGDYAALSQNQPISFKVEKDYACFSIPKLDPWGILVITKE